MMPEKLLNIGCGKHYHQAWTNIDFVSDSKNVIAHNLLKGIPFKNDSFHVAYHSHVLEHFSLDQGISLTNDCFRVLKKGGILRIAIPDLEQITKNYLRYLNEASDGIAYSDFKYEWSKIELLDQIARNYSGGTMGTTINAAMNEDFQFIKSRLGMEIERSETPIGPIVENRYLNFAKKLTWKKIKYYFALFFIFLIGGRDFFTAFKIGYFRSFTGENHQWMYDRYSLYKILTNIGFTDIRVCTAFESRINNFNEYQLDVVDGQIRKPDSLFVEAIKP